jgi:hypothetical protein
VFASVVLLNYVVMVLHFLPADGMWVSGLQKFDKQPEYTEVNPGQDVLMTCKVFNKKGTCSWQKDNKVSRDANL